MEPTAETHETPLQFYCLYFNANSFCLSNKYCQNVIPQSCSHSHTLLKQNFINETYNSINSNLNIKSKMICLLMFAVNLVLYSSQIIPKFLCIKKYLNLWMHSANQFNFCVYIADSLFSLDAIDLLFHALDWSSELFNILFPVIG